MGLSFGEIIVIVLVAFLVLGPDKLPEAGRTLGKTVNSFKKALSDSNLNLKDESTPSRKRPASQKCRRKPRTQKPSSRASSQDLRKDLDLKDHTSNPKA